MGKLSNTEKNKRYREKIEKTIAENINVKSHSYGWSEYTWPETANHTAAGFNKWD